MTEVRVERRLVCPAETVWTLIGDFGGLHRWHPLVRGLDLSWEGRIRTLHFDDGGHAVERLEARNDRARRYAYALVDGPFAVQDCHSTLEVRPGEHRQDCVVVWTSSFEPVGRAGAQADAVLTDLYGTGLRALERVIGMT